MTNSTIWWGGLAVCLLSAAFATRDFAWETVWQSRGFLLIGLKNTMILTVTSIVAGLLIGIPVAAIRLNGPFGARHLAVGYIEVIRSVPQLMVIFWIYFTYPALTGESLGAWSAALIALTLISSAYMAEIIRAGLRSVPTAQRESGFASGLSSYQIFRAIVLPQALRNMVPALISVAVMMLKITSLVYVIGIMDFFRVIVLINNREYAPYALYTVMAVGYFVLSFSLSTIVRKLDPKYTINT